jgi:hypothetical protein
VPTWNGTAAFASLKIRQSGIFPGRHPLLEHRKAEYDHDRSVTYFTSRGCCPGYAHNTSSSSTRRFHERISGSL